MSKEVCLYFQVHQPFRLRNLSIFDVGSHTGYFDEEKNAETLSKVAKKCYLPANKIIAEALRRHDGFKVAFSITGTVLEQFERYAPEVLESFKALAASGRVEFLGETYHHSLSFLFDRDEFRAQIDLHRKAIKRHFGQSPRVFRNTELIFNNELGRFLQEEGYRAVLAEGADHILSGRSPNEVYHPATAQGIRLLLKNYKLSDDIAFRFGDKSWSGYPLSAEKFAQWIEQSDGGCVNLFLDYETFGEHQWSDTGIFSFLGQLPLEFGRRGIRFVSPGELASRAPADSADFHLPVSWADIERDTSAWLGNRMQDAAAKGLYGVKAEVMASGDADLIEDWRRLSTSDHFYYMCTKWFNDGDVHKYFNPHESPYECFMAFMNALRDMKLRVSQKQVAWQSVGEVRR